MATTMDPLAGLGLPKAKKRKTKQQAISPQEAESLLSTIGHGVVSGLGAVGNVLDLPGSTLRDVLAGANPFDQWLSPVSSENRTGGRELLEKWGALGANQDGIDLGDVAGFGAEVLLDPLLLLAGPGRALTGSMKAAKAAGKTLAQTPAGLIDDIAKGERGLLALRLPFADKPLATIGKGKTGAKIAEKLYYNPVTSGIRQKFDQRVSKLTSGLGGKELKAAMKAADVEFEALAKENARISNAAVELQNGMDGLADIYESDIKNFLETNDDARQLLFGEHATADSVKSLTIDDVVRALGENKGIDKKLVKKLGDAGVAKSLKDLARHAGESPDFLEKADRFDSLTSTLVKLKDSIRDDIIEMGGDVKTLDDTLTAHMPRRPSATVRRLLGKGKNASARRDTFWGEIGRNEALKNIPGGTWNLNRMSRDARLTATAGAEAGGEDSILKAIAILEEDYGVPSYLSAGTKNPASEELARFLARLPKDVLDEGLFGRGVVTDVLDYAKSAASYRSALNAAHQLLADVAQHGDDVVIGPSAEDVFRKVFGARATGQESDDAVTAAMSNFLNKYAQKTGANVNSIPPANKIFFPEETARTVANYLTFHTKPQQAGQIAQLYDKALGLWKGMVYTPFPASHTRNLVSGLWENAITAGINGTRKGLMAAFKVLKGGDDAFLTEFKAHGLIDSGLMAELSNTARKGGDDVPRFGDFPKAIKESKIATNPLSSEQALNPLNFRGFREGLEEGSTFLPAKLGEHTNRTVEFINRYSHYVARRQAGWTPEAAARSTKLTHFDYAQLTDFERRVMRRLMPFYSFSRFNLPYQLRKIIDAPGGASAQTIRGINKLRESNEQGEFIPRWLGQGLVFPTGKDDSGASQYIVSHGLLPVEEAFNRLAFINGRPDVRRTLENIAGQTTPALQYPAQIIAERQFWSHRPKDQLYQWPSSNPVVNDLLHSAPTSRAMTVIRQLFDERKSWPQLAINMGIGGVNATDVDEAALNREMRAILMENLNRAPGVGEFSSPYMRDESAISPEIMRQLSLYQMLLKQAKAK